MAHIEEKDEDDGHERRSQVLFLPRRQAKAPAPDQDADYLQPVRQQKKAEKRRDTHPAPSLRTITGGC